MDGNPSSTYSLAKATLSNLENSHLVISLLFLPRSIWEAHILRSIACSLCTDFFLFTLQKCLQFNSIVAKNDSLLSFTLAHIIANSSDFIFRAFFSQVVLMKRDRRIKSP